MAWRNNRSPVQFSDDTMSDNVSAYFQASKELATKLSEMRSLKIKTMPGEKLRLMDRQVQLAYDRVDELLEIFTWETQHTDLIRSAFLAVAKNTLTQVRKIRDIDEQQPASPANATEWMLVDNISNALRKALSSRGRYVPHIEIPKGLAEWCYQVVESYLQTLFRQLQSATFDNLLEAVTYFEKSTFLLKMQYQMQRKTKRY